jgi:hypothetical protein
MELHALAILELLAIVTVELPRHLMCFAQAEQQMVVAIVILLVVVAIVTVMEELQVLVNVNRIWMYRPLVTVMFLAQ